MICFAEAIFMSILSVFGEDAICSGTAENCDCDTYDCSYMDETKYPYYTYGTSDQVLFLRVPSFCLSVCF